MCEFNPIKSHPVIFYTPSKTNVAPEKVGVEDDYPILFGRPPGRCYVSVWEG